MALADLIRSATYSAETLADTLESIYELNVPLGDTTGSSNAYVGTTGYSFTSLTEDAIYTFTANFTNTGAATLNIDSIGAVNIRLLDGSLALIAGMIRSGLVYRVMYDGTQFILLNPSRGTYTPTFSGSSGSWSSHTTSRADCQISGTEQLIIIDTSGTLNTTSAYLIITTPYASTLSSNVYQGFGQIRRNGSAAFELAQVTRHGSSASELRINPANGTSITNSTGVAAQLWVNVPIY